MFADGYIAISFEGLVGIIVTIVGIWFVVQQLREAKLSSQMQGMMEFSDRFAANNRSNHDLVHIVKSEDWDELSDEEAHAKVFASDPTVTSWSDTLLLFELIAVLVRRKALDKRIALDYIGYMSTIWWKRLEKVNRQQAVELGVEIIGEHWEWLVGEFEKMNA